MPGKHLFFVVLALFVLSSTEAELTPTAAKQLQLATPSHESTIKGDNRLLRANDREEMEAEERAPLDIGKGISQFTTKSLKSMETRYQRTKADWLALEQASDKALVKKGTSFAFVEQYSSQHRAGQYKKFLTEEKDKVVQLLNLPTSSLSLEQQQVKRAVKEGRPSLLSVFKHDKAAVDAAQNSKRSSWLTYKPQQDVSKERLGWFESINRKLYKSGFTVSQVEEHINPHQGTEYKKFLKRRAMKLTDLLKAPLSKIKTKPTPETH